MTFRLRRVRSNPLARLSTWALTAALALGLPWAGVTWAAGNETPAALSVGSDPLGAQVYVDGKLRGETPLTVERVSAGDHRVKVVKDGYLENSRVVTVATGQSNSLRVNLTPSGRTSNARMQVEPEPVPPSTPPVVEKGGGGGGKVALIALGVAAAGAGGYLLLKPKNKAPVAGSISQSPAGMGLMAATEFTFTASGANDPDGDAMSFNWSFGDGGTGGGQTVTHVFSTAGTFSVTLKVSDGKKTTDAQPLSVTVKGLTGNWFFTLPSYGTSYDQIFTLTQTGTTFTGTRVYVGSSYTYAVTGSVSPQRTVTFTLWGTATGEASQDVNTISGIASGDTFRMTRR